MDQTGQKSFLFAFGLAILAGLGAFPTALLMIGAVLLGRYLDQTLQTSPLFILSLLCITIPISMFLMLMLARAAARIAHGRSQPVPSTIPIQSEEDDT